MKKLTYLLFLAIGVTACSVESIDSTENLITADAKFRSQSAVTITAPEGVLCVGETYMFSVDVNTTSNFQVQQLIGGVWTQVHLANQGQTGSAPFAVVLEEGENSFRYTNQGSGSNWVVYPSTFTGTDCNTCEDSLEVDLECGETNTATFTFTAEEAGSIVIQGGLTSGTTITSSGSNVLTRVDHQSAGGPSNVTRWEGVVEACDEVTVTISFTGGNGIGDWSAKRGEEVLGSSEAQECN